MSTGSNLTFLDALRDGRLLTPVQRDEVEQNLQIRYPDQRVLAKELMRRGWLTAYQVNQLLKGRGADLLMGSYIVLERLGEGGTGQVFKARHQKMNRNVALKIIRAALLADPVVVQRFYREVQVLSQLSHPNIVDAFDAGPIGDSHFLAMEHVEGIDLSKLVKRDGPLPTANACEYVRQAALGLQHVHDHGMIHRDVKPANLLLTVAGVIKVLDLGLARLRPGGDGEATHSLTPVGTATIGTPDYLAPEQALDSHEVDIRADVYSLGCTFYYLLTGKPPFPDGTMAQKLMKHQQAPPPPIERYRPDLVPAVGVVVHRMLAKKPAERYQTPAEVVEALDRALGGRRVVAPADARSQRLSTTVPLSDALADTAPVSFRGRRWLALLLVAGLFLSLLGFGLMHWLGSSRENSQSGANTVISKGPSAPGAPGDTSLLTELRPFIKPDTAEERWREIPWLTSLWQARQRGAATGKPILLWEAAGHPFGCTCSDGIVSRAVFSDPEIIRQVRDHFVAVVGDEWYQRRRNDAEGRFWKQVSDHRIPKPRDNEGRLGIYCFSAGGKLLAYRAMGPDPVPLRAALRHALDEWHKLPEEQRKPGTVAVESSPAADARFVRELPPGGRIVNVWTRILERDGPRWRRGKTAAACDHLWLTAAENQLPAGLRVGSSLPLPGGLAQRVARFHLVDNTRGEPTFWRREDVRTVNINLTVRAAAGDALHLTLDGTALLTAQAADSKRAERGFDARLSGQLSYDLRQKTWTRFDVVAVGDHWGEAPGSEPARPGRVPLGVCFELARGAASADAVPPGGARDLTEYLSP